MGASDFPRSGDRYHYELDLEIPATDAAVLADALEGEAFGLRARLGAEALERQIENQHIEVHAWVDERWPEFERDIEVLSLYLADDIVAREAVRRADGSAVAWKIIGHRGETVRLRLNASYDEQTDSIEIGDEDVEDASRRWSTLPRWIKTSLRTRNSRFGSFGA